jgi:hypothetical protein
VGVKGGLQRRLATGVNAVIVAVLMVGIVGVVAELSRRTSVRWDLTQDAAASLEPESLAVIDELDGQGVTVRITAFTAQARNSEATFKNRLMRDFLATLDAASTQIDVSLVDMDRDRLTAETLGVDRYGTVVIEGRDDRVDLSEREVFRSRGSGAERELEFLGEAAIMMGIRQVLSDRARRVYVLSGHGERTLFDRGIGELKILARLVEEQGWTFAPLDLLADRAEGQPPSVPDDASVVVALGPRHALTPQEEDALSMFLGAGGSVGWFVEPDGTLPLFIEALGVLSPAGVVLSEEFVYPFPDRPIVRPRRHPITQVLLEDDLRAEVAHAAPLEIVPREGVRAEPLLQTGRRGWVERSAERPAVFTAGIDGEGPVTVAVAVSAGAGSALVRRGTARVVVVGDVDVLGDEVIDEAPGNRTFVVNALRWLVRADDRIARVGRPGRIRRLAMTPEQLSQVRWFVMGLMPLLAVLAGALVRWFRRRA